MSAVANDYLVALKLQLQENGAGDFDSLEVMSSSSDESLACYPNQDLALAFSLDATNRAVADDFTLAREIASKENGLPADTEQPHAAHHAVTNNPKHPTAECKICFDLFTPTMTFNSGQCEHTFCFSCMSQYLKLVVQRGHPYPINCPSCRVIIPNDKCLSALSGTGKEYEALERLIINKEFTKRIRYCANETCAMPFDWVRDNVGGHNIQEEARIICPFCDTETCALCRCVWHDDQTCEQYSLQKDVELLSVLSRQKGWTRCPDCGHLIEKRTGDCAFVTCECGCGFCHTCGTAYMSVDPTNDNVHGRPGCRCALFPEADQSEEDERLEVLEDEENELLDGLERLVLLDGEIHPRIPVRLPEIAAPVRADIGANARAPEHRPQDGLWGPNGRVSLRMCLEGTHQFMGAPLPHAMMQSLKNCICPYEECELAFRGQRALEQHLAFVRRHQVHLCCDRPFYTYASMMNHVRNNHNVNAKMDEMLDLELDR